MGPYGGLLYLFPVSSVDLGLPAQNNNNSTLHFSLPFIVSTYTPNVSSNT
jgi:hypothetical protein